MQSRVRFAVFGADRPEFTGIVAWRVLVPRERVPAGIKMDVGTNWVGPGGHVVHYPVRGGQLLNFVGLLERDDWRVESWTVQGSKDEFANDFRNWHPDIHATIRSGDMPYKWALFARPPMPAWTKGRVTLLGDACHSMLPMLAQGAVMALEDGLVLGALREEIRRRAGGIAGLRGGAARARQPRGVRLGRKRQALPQSRPRPRRGRRSLRHARMAGGQGQGALRMAVHLRRDQRARVAAANTALHRRAAIEYGRTRMNPFFPQPAGLTVREIGELTGAVVRSGGRLDNVISGIAALEQARPFDLTFIDSVNYVDQLAATRAGVCLTTERFAEQAPAALTVLVTAKPFRDFVVVARRLYPDSLRPRSLFEAASGRRARWCIRLRKSRTASSSIPAR